MANGWRVYGSHSEVISPGCIHALRRAMFGPVERPVTGRAGAEGTEGKCITSKRIFLRLCSGTRPSFACMGEEIILSQSSTDSRSNWEHNTSKPTTPGTTARVIVATEGAADTPFAIEKRAATQYSKSIRV